MKWKIPLLCLGLFLLYISFSNVAFGDTIIARGSGFNVYFSVNSKLAFQGDNTLFINVTSGLLNGTSGSLSLYNNRGSFSFTATDNSTVEVSSPDAEGGFDIDIYGANSTSNLGNFTWIAAIQSGDNVKIVWSYRLESWIDKYAMFGIGIGGIALMVASPTWVALKLRKRVDADSMERVGYGMLLFLIGFGLLVTWLWS